MTEDNLPPIVDRVAAGIALLDQQQPGWDKHIDLGTLELESCKQCVLGQLFGGYIRGAEALDLDDPAQVGFDLDAAESDAAYDELTAAWTAAIRARRQAVAG